MKLEEATSNNTCEYSLTGKHFRVKLLGRMKCNKLYATFAVEIEEDHIYKVYTLGECAKCKKDGDIFYVKFGRQRTMDDLTRIYSYALCDINGKNSQDDEYYQDDFFKLDYENYFTGEYTDEYMAKIKRWDDYSDTE